MKPKKAGKSFSERVVEAALSIPSGRVTTYGRLARACGAGQGAKSDDDVRSQQAKGHMSARSITGILGKAYQNGETSIPLHRIVYADGGIWTSPEYHAKRMKLYKQEGIKIDTNNKIKNFKDIVFDFQ